MGCSCATSIEAKSYAIQEALADPARYCAYPLPVSEPDYVLLYDFQLREGRILKLVVNPALEEYTVHINHPLLFVIGGVEKDTKEISSKIWVTSAGDDTVHMSSSRLLSEPRKKPFALSPKEGNIYIVGGTAKNGEYSRACERMKIGGDMVSTLRQMSLDHDLIITVGKYMYALGKIEMRNTFEVFDSFNEGKGWDIIDISSSEKEFPLNWITGFGAVSEDEQNEKILVFGGQKKDITADTYIVNVKRLEIEPLKKDLAIPDAFFMPTTTGKAVAFAISKGYRLYAYDKHGRAWRTYSTNIAEQIAKKGLHIIKP